MEYIIQDSTLQGIADAIRAKAGTSDPITTSAFASAIAAIEAGGGGGIDGFDVATGTIIPTEDITTTYTLDSNDIPFECPAKSRYVLLFRSHEQANEVKNALVGSFFFPVGPQSYPFNFGRTFVGNNSLRHIDDERIADNLTDGIRFLFTEKECAFAQAGVKYYWIVLKEKTA